jgi:hypothetical protein
VTLSIAVVCDAPADRATATGLADRVLCAEVDWIEESVLDSFRTYRGLEPTDAQLVWHEVPALAHSRRIRAHGHFGEEPGEDYAKVARQALFLLLSSTHRPDSVLLILDEDRKKERSKGLEQARSAVAGLGPVVIGVQRRCRECWVLAGFAPCNEREQECLAELCRELGFDPRSHADRLNAQEHQPRNPKRVLRELLQGEAGREADCWRKPTLAVLQTNGQNTGLADYLRELRERLLPLFLNPSPP